MSVSPFGSVLASAAVSRPRLYCQTTWLVLGFTSITPLLFWSAMRTFPSASNWTALGLFNLSEPDP